MKPQFNNNTQYAMDLLKNKLKNFAALRKNGNAVKKAQQALSAKHTYAIFFLRKESDAKWLRYKPDRPIATELFARLLADGMRRNDKYHAVKVCHWNAEQQQWIMLKLQL